MKSIIRADIIKQKSCVVERQILNQIARKFLN